MRIRKVKCDQGRPACHRCLSTGRTCDGEIGTGAVSAVRQRPIVPRPGDSHRCLAAVVSRSTIDSHPITPTVYKIISPWVDLASDLSDYEIHGFRHFEVLTAPAMGMMLPSSAWISVALQMSSQHPAIFHAITATGTLARSLTVLIHPSFPRPVLNHMAEEAALQFRKAIRVLRESVDRVVSSSVAIEPILLSCLLCVCFEAFRGRKSAAVSHARLGWNIVEDYSRTANMDRSPSAAFFKSIYPQHAGAYALFDDKEHHDMHCCQEDLNTLPNGFSSVEEATNSLVNLTKHAEHFRTELLQLAKTRITRTARLRGLSEEVSFCLAACLSKTVSMSRLQQSRLEQLKTAHTQWRQAYTRYQDTSPRVDDKAHLILHIRHFYSAFALATCRDTKELLADQFLGEFEDTLACVERYLTIVRGKQIETRRPSPEGQPNHSTFFGFSILPALHLIAHKCREPHLRSRALHILSTAHKQEGLEYSGLFAMYAQAVTEIENRKGSTLAQRRRESNHQHLQSKILPEEARIADCVTTGQGARGIFRLTCARYVHENVGTQEVELTQYEAGAVPLRLVSSWKLAI